jgi:hypothetical protein
VRFEVIRLGRSGPGTTCPIPFFWGERFELKKEAAKELLVRIVSRLFVLFCESGWFR